MGHLKNTFELFKAAESLNLQRFLRKVFKLQNEN